MPMSTCASGSVGLGLVLQLPRRFFQKLAIHLVADRRDMAGLLGAENVARAAKFQIAHGDLKARAKMAVFLDRLQALGRDRRHRAIRRQQQIAIRPMLPPPHAAAKLVQFAQAEAVGVVDDDRVGVGNIQAAFDDRRADQDVRLVADELHHHVFQLPFAHLPVADDDAGIGDQLLNLIGHLDDVLHAVVNEIDLPLAIELAQDRLLHALLVVRHHFRHDAPPILRRGGQRADIAQPEHAHVQRARDRRGRHGQHIHRLAHLLQSLFMRHAKALLFVDDDQAQVGEFDVLADEPMRADEDIDLALGQPLDTFPSARAAILKRLMRCRSRTDNSPSAP